MAKREGVEIDGLFLSGLAAPLDYVQQGWERQLGHGCVARAVFGQSRPTGPRRSLYASLNLSQQQSVRRSLSGCCNEATQRVTATRLKSCCKS